MSSANYTWYFYSKSIIIDRIKVRSNLLINIKSIPWVTYTTKMHYNIGKSESSNSVHESKLNQEKLGTNNFNIKYSVKSSPNDVR